MRGEIGKDKKIYLDHLSLLIIFPIKKSQDVLVVFFLILNVNNVLSETLCENVCPLALFNFLLFQVIISIFFEI